ncbi:BamA/TamA family outer membrane protein [Labilibacter marinus]|uniref:BamA/TamA family outer membrane protein n=1 Tax=Labilibacter marinus TaxID=1477105 RepID=UPI00094F615B|nr:BamA/TamA family outer membrane protein [Labilibacter marinus]
MKKVSVLFIVASFLLGAINLSAQADEEEKKTPKEEKEKKEKKVSLIPLPVIAVNPTNGLMYGVAPGASWFMGDKSNTSISSGLGTIIYTTNKQLILTAKTNVFLSGDKWNILSDWRYFMTSQPTFGLGTGPNSNKVIHDGFEYDDNQFSKKIETAQQMEFNFIRLHQTALRKHQDTRLFYGLGYHYDYHFDIKDNLLDIESDPPVLTSHYLYQEHQGFSQTEYTTSGVSFNLLFDSRDNAINPYSGRYAFVNLRVNPEFLGSDQSSSILWAEYRDYIHFDQERPRHLLGFWTYGWFVTSGKVPYLDLPAVGWDQFGNSGRAYTQGRFRGEDIWYGETEYRFPLQKNKETLGGVVFVNGTTASSRTNDINLFDYLDVGYGAGLRVMINKKSRTNLTLDYAWGNHGAKGFYLGLNEKF